MNARIEDNPAAYDALVRSLCRAVLRTHVPAWPAPAWVQGADEWLLEHAGCTWQSGIPADVPALDALDRARRSAGLHVIDAAHLSFWSTLDDEARAHAKKLCEKYGGGDFDETCLGVLDTYEALSRIIPKSRVIYDVGCAYAFQAWFFRDHRAYVGIADSPKISRRFKTKNARHVHARIEDFTETLVPGHFAIHNYCNGGRAAVARIFAFSDLYSFYPQAEDFGDLARGIVS